MNNIPFQGKRIILGVTGSIAGYKAADLASKLRQAGAEVDVILTPSARLFITPLTFQSVTGRRAYIEEDLWGREGHVLHIGLAENADLLLVAPATANTLAKLAHGLADNLLTITALAASCPLMIAPAMDGDMFTHPATQANLSALQEQGAIVVGPAKGPLASGMTGFGRLVEPTELLGHIRLGLGRGGPLQGRKFAVTAGGTQEPIDPVRRITNRSSGKQGYALAQAALDLGASVTLISADTALNAPVGARLVRVVTAQEMDTAVMAELPGCEVLIMAAAVADFRPMALAPEKIKKADGVPRIKLEPTPDILEAVATQRADNPTLQAVVGFAAESQNLMDNARRKLVTKKLDLMVANDITDPEAGFGVDSNRVILLRPDASVERLPLMTKAGVAQVVMAEVGSILAANDKSSTGRQA